MQEVLPLESQSTPWVGESEVRVLRSKDFCFSHFSCCCPCILLCEKNYSKDQIAVFFPFLFVSGVI